MPTWSSSLTTRFPSAPELRTESDYHLWFLRLCGILGDPIAAKTRIAAADKKGIKLGAAAYGYRPAFKNRLGSGDIRLLQEILSETWDVNPIVLDPTAGGGSIPYQSIRLGLPTIANDLNPVASAILRATLELPARSGTSLAEDVDRWGGILVSRVRDRLLPFFQLPDNSTNNSYLFARTVACPRTGKPVPLSPNWWLSSGDVRVAVRLHTERAGVVLDRVEYEIVRGSDIDFDPDRGTVAGGDAVSPWDNLAIGGDYIREEAQAGRMGSDLYAVAIRTHNGRGFRAPVEIDRACLALADEEATRNEARWAAEDVIPTEEFPFGNDNRPIQYGMRRWRDMYSKRQLLVHAVFVEEFRRLRMEIAEEHSATTSDALGAILAFMMPKALRFDSMLSRWHPGNQNIVPAFDRHDFSIKWTYAEFEGARELYPWCLSQVVDAYREVSELMRPADHGPLAEDIPWPVPGPVTVSCGNAADLGAISDRSVALVCIDPPYYDNVMYAELADYFYVWEKRTLGLIYPDSFAETLTDKKNEAVANMARFADAGRRRKELAAADYEAKMAAIFAECSRVLRDDGVLTVMFTHKRAEAWDTLGMGLLEAGFRIETSWPLNTESEQSLHQANKNAAASTIFLVCRKRDVTVGQPPFFEDLEGDVRSAVRDAVDRFSSAGLSGVDLMLSTYGPALSVISSHWPVYSSDADPLTGRSRLLRPEEALDAARSEVVRMQRRRLVGTDVQFDAYTDFELIAWETFKAAEFPFDEARRLALATGGLDVDDLARARLVEKKAGTVVLLPPERRLRRGSDDDLPGVRPEEVSFPIAIDAVHTVMYVAATDGLPAARALIDRAGLATDQRFLGCLQGLVNAIPRTRTKAGWARKEAEMLDRLCAAYFPGIVMPRAQEAVENLGLWT
jgi:adenine-specific DNA methylase